MKPRIVVDAMGGDNAPQEIVAGALMAAGGLDVELFLVGKTKAIEEELSGTHINQNLSIIDAPDVIPMEARIDVVKGMPGASLNVGMQMIKNGEADALVTAGNTAATLTSAMVNLRRIKGLSRPALAAFISAGEGKMTLMLDVGANAESKPGHLIQYAHMGSVTMEKMYGIQNPRVGLLSNGEEDTKGNTLTLTVNRSLRKSDLNFIGNIEAGELPQHVCDVAIMDGFTGNIVMKTAEGIAELFTSELERAVRMTPWNLAAGLVLKSELRKTQKRLDYREFGGGQLLGTNGIVVIGHGRSNSRAIFSGIRAARDAVENNLLEVITEVAGHIPEVVNENT